MDMALAGIAGVAAIQCGLALIFIGRKDKKLSVEMIVKPA